MNLNEFRAFVEGIEHAFGGEAPNAEQWQLIKDRLHQVETGSKPKPEDLFPIKRDTVRVNPWQYPNQITSGEAPRYTVGVDMAVDRDPYPRAFERDCG